MKGFLNHKLELALCAICLLIIILVPSLGVLIAFALVFILFLIDGNRKQNFKSLGFKKPNSWWKTILICFAFGAVIQLFYSIVFDPLIEEITAVKIDLSNFDGMRGNLVACISMLLVGWVVGGFCEEILFRGFLLNKISSLFKSRHFGDTIAILVTAIAFGFSHFYQGISGMLSTGTIALLLGLIYVKCNRNIWYSIFTHGFIDMVGLTLIYFDLDLTLNGLLF